MLITQGLYVYSLCYLSVAGFNTSVWGKMGLDLLEKAAFVLSKVKTSLIDHLSPHLFTFNFSSVVKMNCATSSLDVLATDWAEMIWIRGGQGHGGLASHRHKTSNYLPSSFVWRILHWAVKTQRKRRREEELWKRGKDEGRGLRDYKRKRDWKPSENPYTWFIPVRLCAVGRSYLLFMRASAAKRPDVKLCGDLI